MNIERLCKSDPESMSIIQSAVKGKKIALVTRMSKPACTYSVIGYYLFSIMKAAGANIRRINETSARLRYAFDVGIYSNYETRPIIQRRMHLLKSMRSQCGQCIFYANVVPYIPGIDFDRYCVSRKEFLKPDSKWYAHKAYRVPTQKALRAAVYVGRGVDPFTLVPCQNEFRVCIDAMRNAYRRRAVEILDAITKEGFQSDLIGFNSAGGKAKKRPFISVVQTYNLSSVYISTIHGIFEMPLLEAQCSGNNVISYKDCLIKELCCPETTFICDTPEQVVEVLSKLSKDIDRDAPRKFASQWLWTRIVAKICQQM